MKIYSEIFKALTDDTRLSILALLFIYGEMCVCDVEGILKISQSKASRHLRYLKNAGLIDDRREGIWVYYHISTDDSDAASDILAANRTMIQNNMPGDLKKTAKTWFKNKTGNSCKLS